MKTILYGDSADFYETLQTTIRSGEPVEVETEYSSLPEIPGKLRDMFHLDAVANPSWVDGFTGKFVPGAKVPTKANLRGIIAAGTAVAGAGAGALAGGPVGAGVGAVVGAGVGAVIAALTQEKVRAHIEIDVRGKLVIKVEPK